MKRDVKNKVGIILKTITTQLIPREEQTQPVPMPHLLAVHIAIWKHEGLVVLIQLLPTDVTHQAGLGAVGIGERGGQGVEGRLAHRAIWVVACRPLK